jgi:hypothetical protein
MLSINQASKQYALHTQKKNKKKIIIIKNKIRNPTQ